MLKHTLIAATTASLAAVAGGQVQVVAGNDFDGNTPNLLSATLTPDNSGSTPAGTFPTSNFDAFGVIDTSAVVVDDYDKPAGDFFIGVAGTQNSDNAGPVNATYVFDTSSVVSFETFSIDLGAIGDFESGDTFSFSAAIDGGTAIPLIDVIIDEDGTQDYTDQNGVAFTKADPATVGGVNLTDVFQTFTVDLSAVMPGDTLSFIFDGNTNGSEENFAFDNVAVTGVIPEPASLGLLATAGLGLLRRHA
jgi:hypothetical protein